MARQARRLANLPEAPWLYAEVAARLAAKLDPILLTPATWIDWGGFLGAGGDLVQARYPQAQRWIVEPTSALQQRSQMASDQATRPSWRTLWRRASQQVSCAQDLTGAPWVPNGADMLWANMALHAHANLPALVAKWHQQLAIGGFLMCSGLGPDTARELRTLYGELGWPMPTINFIDMHDLGDELVQAGFSDPVMDMETLTLTWATPQAMLDELRSWGGNVAGGRHVGLRTPRWRDRLMGHLSDKLMRPDGRLGLTIELIYGHAIKPEPRHKVAPETRVSLQDMKRMIHKPGKP